MSLNPTDLPVILHYRNDCHDSTDCDACKSEHRWAEALIEARQQRDEAQRTVAQLRADLDGRPSFKALVKALAQAQEQRDAVAESLEQAHNDNRRLLQWYSTAVGERDAARMRLESVISGDPANDVQFHV